MSSRASSVRVMGCPMKRKPVSGLFMTRRRGSFRFFRRVHGLDDAGPALGFALDEAGEILRAAAGGIEALALQALQNDRMFQRRIGCFGEFVDHGLRQTAGSEDAEPEAGGITGQTRFGN